jgi:hypothetical protein
MPIELMAQIRIEQIPEILTNTASQMDLVVLILTLE